MAGPDRLVTTDRMRAIDKLRRQQRILRGAGTRLLKAATDLLEAASPHPHELQAAIDLLERNDAALYETEKKII